MESRRFDRRPFRVEGKFVYIFRGGSYVDHAPAHDRGEVPMERLLDVSGQRLSQDPGSNLPRALAGPRPLGIERIEEGFRHAYGKAACCHWPSVPGPFSILLASSVDSHEGV